MFLNTIKSSQGAKKAKARVGRGIGSGSGKTCGRGHKGQRSRSGGYHKVGFEGGQMPLQRRVPKFGFTSLKSLCHQEIRLYDLNRMESDEIDLATLLAEDIIKRSIKTVKVVASGDIKRAVTLKGIAATKGARAAIEAAGGKVED